MFGKRLKEERTRLKLTQPMLADCVGSAKRTVIDWEQEKSSPTARQLIAMQELGVDTGYLLTGQRTALTPTPTDEKILIEQYRSLSDDKKKVVLQFLLGGIDSLNTGNNINNSSYANATITDSFNNTTPNHGYVNQGTHKGDVNFEK